MEECTRVGRGAAFDSVSVEVQARERERALETKSRADVCTMLQQTVAHQLVLCEALVL